MPSFIPSTKHADSCPNLPPAFIIVGEFGKKFCAVIISKYSVILSEYTSSFLAANNVKRSLKLTFIWPLFASVT